MFVLFVMQSYLTEVRGLKLNGKDNLTKLVSVVPYRGTWVETTILPISFG